MITGSIVALVTPMLPNGTIDWDALSALVEWHIDMGTSAIVPVGTTGESATVTVDEHCQIVAYVVKAVAGRVPVIAGTGGNATSEAIELTAAAKDAGADACLLVTPYYNKPTQEGLFRHYEAIASAVDLPQVRYNVPGRTACDMIRSRHLGFNVTSVTGGQPRYCCFRWGIRINVGPPCVEDLKSKIKPVLEQPAYVFEIPKSSKGSTCEFPFFSASNGFPDRH